MATAGSVSMPSKTSACGPPARASWMIFNAVGKLSARLNFTSMPGYFFWKASTSGRTAWLTMSVVYQTTCPSAFAAW